MYKGEDVMGRKASKATDNIYYMARCNAALENDIFSSREKAAAKLGIERSRLARIELDKIEPYSEEVIIMAKEYNAPYLCDNYCNSVCPIGMKRLEEAQEGTARYQDSLERLALRFLSSTQCIDDISKKLVNISKDGMITEDEFENFRDVLSAMDALSDNINSIKEWISENPSLTAHFSEDLS
jgi:transcriptional regulator with XRE-family HTH domain